MAIVRALRMPMVRAVRMWALPACALLIAVGGCKKPATWAEHDVDFSLVKVESDLQNLRHDTVGEGEFAAPASFVLVDARNEHDRDLIVTLGGDLVDEAGAVVGTLRPESLWVPPGIRRTFALIDDKNSERKTAVTARVKVVGAHMPSYEPSIGVEAVHVYAEGDHLLASARIANKAERAAKVIVLAAFRDAAGKPMTRPFMLIQLDPDTSRPVDFRSPPGAASGTIFVGETVY